MDFLALEQSVWTRLQEEKRPIVLYGMGDGADKILRQFERLGIQAAAVFASDEFVRGHSFRGFRVHRLDEVVDAFGEDILIVIVPVVEGAVFDEAFVRAHSGEMERAYALLADERSRAVFLDTVRFKLSGRLCYLRASETDKDEAFRAVLRLGPEEHFADLGAYNGDTIRELLHYTGGRFASVTALEPDRRSFRKLSAYAEEQLAGDITLEQAGAWSEDTVLCFSDQAGRQSRISRAGRETRMRALDSVLRGRPCTYLKMDVEGAEREALRGAAQTIRSWRPKLNLAAYHRSGDFFSLALQVHALCPDYRLYLRHHPYVPAWDTNLYAVGP